MKIKRIVEIPSYPLPKRDVSIPPILIYNNGPLISPAQVSTLFWGSYWQKAENQKLMTSINDFFKTILESSVITQLKEYSTPQFPIKTGKFLGTGVYTNPKFPLTIAGRTVVTDNAIKKMIQFNIDNTHVPAATPNNLYFVYLPPGIIVSLDRTFSCVTFCGYHSNTAQNLFYAVVPYPCSNCLNGLSVFDAMTVITSHELCEAITDPIPGSGWYDNNYGEVGDICVGKTKKVGSYTVQLEWSNAAKNCV